ncbi:hypothetical protein V1281_005025 [Nitrobacteraceae bacterium AZCC 2161]
MKAQWLGIETGVHCEAQRISQKGYELLMWIRFPLINGSSRFPHDAFSYTHREIIMKLKFALVGLVALGGAALSAGTASAMPIGLATNADIASNIDQVRLVCDRYGRCFRTPGYAYGYGYGRPHYGYGRGWHRGWHGGRRW